MLGPSYGRASPEFSMPGLQRDISPSRWTEPGRPLADRAAQILSEGEAVETEAQATTNCSLARPIGWRRPWRTVAQRAERDAARAGARRISTRPPPTGASRSPSTITRGACSLQRFQLQLVDERFGPVYQKTIPHNQRPIDRDIPNHQMRSASCDLVSRRGRRSVPRREDHHRPERLRVTPPAWRSYCRLAPVQTGDMK